MAAIVGTSSHIYMVQIYVDDSSAKPDDLLALEPCLGLDNVWSLNGYDGGNMGFCSGENFPKAEIPPCR